MDPGEAQSAQNQATLSYQAGKYCNSMLMGSQVSARPEGLENSAFFVALFSGGSSDERLFELFRQFSQKEPQEGGPVFLRFCR